MTTADDGSRTFEDLMAELEVITEQLASGELGIEAAVDLYERACTVHALAVERLEQVKTRVQRLSTPAVPAPTRTTGSPPSDPAPAGSPRRS